MNEDLRIERRSCAECRALVWNVARKRRRRRCSANRCCVREHPWAQTTVRRIADGSKAEFIAKCGDCLRELEETGYWLELLVDGKIVLPRTVELATGVRRTHSDLRDNPQAFEGIMTAIPNLLHLSACGFLIHPSASAWSLACSDHRPVWIAVRVPNKDDDEGEK